MPRRAAETPARTGYGEFQAAHWNNTIGIDAVTAASMYCDHRDRNRRTANRIYGDIRDEGVVATD